MLRPLPIEKEYKNYKVKLIPFDDEDGNYSYEIRDLTDKFISQDKRRFSHDDSFDNAKNVIDNLISNISQ